MGTVSKKLVSAMVISCLLGAILWVSCWSLQRRHARSSDTSLLLPQTRLLYTTRHLVASGQHAVASFLESHKDTHGNSIAKTLKKHYSACVRVQNRYNFSNENRHFEAAAGSGVIVGGGKFLLTAGHLFASPEDLDFQTKIALTTGQLFDAELCHLEYDKTEGLDLALLKIDIGQIPVLTVEMAEARVGETVFALGYIKNLGIGANGALLGSVFIRDEGNYLEPLVQVGIIQSVSEKIVVVPTVGCIVLDGMSGAPVLDESGNLVGIFVEFHHRQNERGEDEYTMIVTPVITGRENPIPLLIGEHE